MLQPTVYRTKASVVTSDEKLHTSTVVEGILRLVDLESCKTVDEDKVLVKRHLKLSRRRQKNSSKMDGREGNRFCKRNVDKTNSGFCTIVESGVKTSNYT